MSTKVTFVIEEEMALSSLIAELEIRLLLCDALYEFSAGQRRNSLAYAERKADAFGVSPDSPKWDETVRRFREDAERRVRNAEVMRMSVLESINVECLLRAVTTGENRAGS